MIKFRPRNIGCWRYALKTDWLCKIIMEFATEEDLFKYVNDTFDWTTNGDYKLRIKDNVLMYWTVLGFIVE